MKRHSTVFLLGFAGVIAGLVGSQCGLLHGETAPEHERVLRGKGLDIFASENIDTLWLDDESHEVASKLVAGLDADGRDLVRKSFVAKLAQQFQGHRWGMGDLARQANLRNAYYGLGAKANGLPPLCFSLTHDEGASTRLTPTEGYLLASYAFKPYLNVRFNGSVMKLLQQVNELQSYCNNLSERHYSYVHAHNWTLDFAQRMYQELHPSINTSFFPLHFLTVVNGSLSGAHEAEVVEALRKNGRCPEGAYERHLLSMNSPLLGNHTREGECTFFYFMSSWSIDLPEQPVKQLLVAEGHEDLYVKYEAEIEKLAELHSHCSRYGKLWVIMVPQRVHKDVVISARAYGYKEEVIIKRPPQDGREVYQATDDVDLIQDTLCTRPDAIQDLDRLQFRMLMTPSTGLNPDLGIKMFPIHHADPVKYAEFEVAFKELMGKIKGDIATKNKQPISPPGKL